MIEPPAGAVILKTGIVFRLAKITDQFPKGSTKLLASHLSLEEEDKGKLSVYDLARTTTDQARTLMESKADYAAHGWNVEDVHVIRLPRDDRQKLWVIRDIDHSDEREGANGHCAIVGLARPKIERKALRDKLIEKAFHVH